MDTPETQVDIDAIVSKFAAADPEPETEQTQTEPVAEAKPDPTPAKEPSASSRIAELAKLEADLRTREELLKAKEQETPQQDPLEERLKRDPIGVLKDLGVDLGTTAGQMLALELGDKAPEEFKKQLAERELYQRLAALEEAQKQTSNVSEEVMFQTRVAMLNEELLKFPAAVPEAFPLVGKMASKKPDQTYEALSVIAAKAIQAGKWPSVSEIAKALEDEIRADLDLYQDSPPAQSASKPPAKAEPDDSIALSEEDSAERTDRSAPTGLQSDEYYIKRALKAAKLLPTK